MCGRAGNWGLSCDLRFQPSGGRRRGANAEYLAASAIDGADTESTLRSARAAVATQCRSEVDDDTTVARGAEDRWSPSAGLSGKRWSNLLGMSTLRMNLKAWSCDTQIYQCPSRAHLRSRFLTLCRNHAVGSRNTGRPTAHGNDATQR